MEFSAWISIGSLVVALVAVVVGPIVTLRVSRQQTMAPMRLKRIDDLRDGIAEMIGYANHIKIANKEIPKKDRFDLTKPLFYTLYKIELLLSSNLDKHQEIADKLNDLIPFSVKDKYTLDDLYNLECAILNLSKEIFAEQWEKIKEGK